MERRVRSQGRYRFAAVAGGALALLYASPALAQNCFSSNPADWPPPAKPYFMLAVDTSGSMNGSAAANSCKTANGFASNYPDTRIGAARCALTKTVRAFSGQVNFGLATFAYQITGNGPATCPSSLADPPSGCSWSNFSGNTTHGACGPKPGDAATRRGGSILVALQGDSNPPPSPGNVGDVLSWADNRCNDQCHELFAFDSVYTPLNGILRDMYRYLSAGWNKPPKATTTTPYDFPTPLTGSERACRSINVILLTDGAESCDSQSDATAAATQLWNGFNITTGSQTTHWNVHVHVIDAVNATPSSANQDIANAGHGVARGATSEQALSTAFAEIIGSAIKPETCNNTDDNCNGCVDEGYRHYCNRNKTAAPSPTTSGQCCNWTTTAQRQSCINNYQSSITASNPTGNLYLLPCYTPPAAQLGQNLSESDKWLCYDPGDVCDNQDNNCEGSTPNASQVDEGSLKCGGHCPTSETCNQVDDNCDGIVDNAQGSSGPYSLPNCQQCTPSAELCDGCDNDCDGVADDGIDPISCGVPTPASCLGTISCQAPQAVARPGACIGAGPSNRWGTCSSTGHAETCDGVDNNCNGTIDEGLSPAPCDVPGTPGLVYHDTNPLSQCVRGQQPCNGQCTGWVAPTQEICDGLDNDCDGLVDSNDPDMVGAGQVCDGLCAKGTTACVNGALICNSNVQPQPEVCDGRDNDCNGIVDDGTLLDAPAAANRPCWALAATSCTTPCTYTGASGTTSWCAPAGAGCRDLGSLQGPCHIGELQCQGGSWSCVGSVGPNPEVCDGLDNNCNGSADDGLTQSACGTDQGECQSGTQLCVNGVLQCQNEVGPNPEICDGLDNDCDGIADNGIAIGTACTPPYDTALYPGPRNSGICHPGVAECSPSGEVICNGGVGPGPEVCDGLDNDCDGQVDEAGLAPDGINGTANPQNPGQIIGQSCGQNQGACKPGTWACTNAQFVCAGAVSPQPEICDCQDNDCDGQIDEDPASGSSDPALCSADKACVSYAGGCQCAAACGGGEFPCPTGGFACETVDHSGHVPTESAGPRCVIDGCQDCEHHTETTSDGRVICAPSGTVLDGGQQVPVCACKQNRCQNPCAGVSCGTHQVCTDYGPHAGSCVEDNCWNVPCVFGQVCNLGSCITNPCHADSCQADQVCRPKPDFSGFDCVSSCAGVSCQPSQVCRDGQCIETGCAQPCDSGQVCVGGDAGGCVPNKCTPDTCANGSYCEPTTGACGNNPCEGVVCPSGQSCAQGQCELSGAGGAGGAAGSGGSGGAAGSSGGSGNGGTGGQGAAGSGGEAGGTAGNASPTGGNWGLATGGGGCACKTSPGAGTRAETGAALGWLALLWLARGGRRRREVLREGADNGNIPRHGRDGGGR